MERVGRRSGMCGRLVAVLAIAALGAWGCAAAKVSHQGPVTRAELAPPSRVDVFDFAAVRSDRPMPAELGALLGHGASRKSAPSDTAHAKVVAADLTEFVTAALRERGIEAQHVSLATPPEHPTPGTLQLFGAIVHEDADHHAAALGLGEGRLTAKLRLVMQTRRGRALVQAFSARSSSELEPADARESDRNARARAAAEAVAQAIADHVAELFEAQRWPMN